MEPAYSLVYGKVERMNQSLNRMFQYFILNQEVGFIREPGRMNVHRNGGNDLITFFLSQILQ